MSEYVTHVIRNPGPLQATNLRWLSVRAWNAWVWVGMFVFVFLEIERHLALAKVHSIVAVRHAIRVTLNSEDAVSNLEHLLFGFCCALAGFLMAQTLHHLDPAFATDGVKDSKKPPVRERLAQRIPGIGRVNRLVEIAVRRFTLFLARVYAVWRDTPALRFAGRIGFTACVYAALHYFRRDAYSALDIIPAMWLFAVLMWVIWGWRHLLNTTASQPEFVMLAFGFGIWFELDLAWKIVQVVEHKNTYSHAARHLAYSFGAFVISLAWFRLVTMRSRGLNFAASESQPGAVGSP